MYVSSFIHRIVLQFSILYKLTATDSPSVLEPLFSLLAESLSPLLIPNTTSDSGKIHVHVNTQLDPTAKGLTILETNQDPTESTESTHQEATTMVPETLHSNPDPIDTHLVQWIALLLSHILQDREKEDINIFLLSLLIPRERTKVELSQRIKELSLLIDEALLCLTECGHYFEERQKGRSDKMKRKLEKKKKVLTKLTKKLETEGSVGTVDKELRRIDKDVGDSGCGNVDVSSNIMVLVIQGLVSLLERYCNNYNWSAIPVICKVSCTINTVL